MKLALPQEKEWLNRRRCRKEVFAYHRENREKIMRDITRETADQAISAQAVWEEQIKKSMSDIRRDGKDRLNEMLAPTLSDCSAEQNTMTVRYQIFSWELNPRGELHGGSLASMFDVALGLTARCASRSMQVATTDLSISYLRRVEADDAVLIQTKVQKNGRFMTRITAEARSEKTGKTVATAQCSYAVLQSRE